MATQMRELEPDKAAHRKMSGHRTTKDSTYEYESCSHCG